MNRGTTTNRGPDTSQSGTRPSESRGGDRETRGTPREQGRNGGSPMGSRFEDTGPQGTQQTNRPTTPRGGRQDDESAPEPSDMGREQGMPKRSGPGGKDRR
jgi:hypothetical protein